MNATCARGNAKDAFVTPTGAVGFLAAATVGTIASAPGAAVG